MGFCRPGCLYNFGSSVKFSKRVNMEWIPIFVVWIILFLPHNSSTLPHNDTNCQCSQELTLEQIQKIEKYHKGLIRKINGGKIVN